MALFTATELRAFVPRLTDPQCALALEMTADALAGEVGSRITDPPQPGVKAVALAVAARTFTNPEGVRSEQAGGMLTSYADAQTGVALSDDERRRLRRAVGMASGAGSLNIAPEDVALTVTFWGGS